MAKRQSPFDAARIERFLASPPNRISAGAIARRKMRNARRYPGSWLDDLVKEQRGRCHYCHQFMRGHGQLRATIDHKKPLSRGGMNRRSNLVAACTGCNARKGAIPYGEFVTLCAHLATDGGKTDV